MSKTHSLMMVVHTMIMINRSLGGGDSQVKCCCMNRLFLILIFSSLILTSCGAGKPKGGEGISYFGAAWLNNERIIYTKQVETVRFHYGWIV